ncbi:YraN family protein [candidate division WOR-1 bacterium RIFOXYB2_FULL_42_35]|uniref:UPF0102 protein A2462_05860 n=1 Tax=candidate division WOR-1 bacterium RIFOXYC2_FULL_41_25 TaxID=1802586 RepID=A0A1F4TQX5_UNCSA|nr:MAG: YraN family protein [candidate division WOR-1 bacterium RIFOXYA2_FULL_41_14]OGC24850.1 MAG: YraN family protein [candidate division WOR-1 bacterium RIFOXYB2_FULL_42_35]OGC35037.1 MAG: YraN family protein [candidate division WOR-1 bacterium RIFOXYC2_FULL_41_25]OGC43648.1 MAG: YraN family protein [candidate division WOR-1 bacterium RIFOXYD2_FULL_41_8]
MGKESYLLGKEGEQIAQRYLSEQGFRIIVTNFRSAQGEIDLVAQDGDFLVFVEVKSYSFRSYGTPVGAITKNKKRSLIHAARTYIVRHNIKDIYCRFDVLTIFNKQDGTQVIEHYRNAFTIN